MSEQITPPEIPESHLLFAQAVAACAEQFGISRFEMTYEPKFPDRHQLDRRISGDLKIRFSAADGRGRPCRNLYVDLVANLSVAIQQTPPSSN